ncbi:hypothetical protein SASPL_121378 [Salvia splendens]|uniref:Heat shock 70kDa protein 4 n=1 Tax=Salvia splendens TaxID=180675 RepID=A0A8X8XRS5_SALSN|nr:hypothetical protein SASPL_121378 [Salvia splendens]
MSVVGFDFGNQSCVVAVARQGGIVAVPNDESKLKTPSLVSFGDKQRFIGTAATASCLMNPKNTISQIKRLIGSKFSDPELQRDLESLPFSVTEGPDGYPLIHVQYLGENKMFTPTQALGMLFSNLKSIAEKNLNAEVVDCCIGIPVYFTDIQRRAVIDAATIAGLHPLSLIHETDAIALAYGYWETDLGENEVMNVAFVDAGHASLQVCIAAFKKATCQRLRDCCERVKKILGANPEVVSGYIKIEEFEQISTSILERVKKPLEKALADAGLTIQNIHSVEVVGSGSRVPGMIKILTEFFGMEPRCIFIPVLALSFNVNERFPFPISLTWKTPDGDTQSRAGDVQYADVSELQAPAEISRYMIGPFQSTNGQKAKLEVTVHLNLHGIVSVESATLLEEEEVDVPFIKESDNEPAKMETNELPADPDPPSAADVNMQDSKTGAPAAVNGMPELGDKPIQMETKVDAMRKKVNKKTVPVSEVVSGALAAPDVQKAVEEELEMALQDRVMKETNDMKNAVKSYAYDMRIKLHGKYHDFVMDSEREQLITSLQEVEEWLSEDGKDETKDVYVAKLEELKKQGDPIEESYKEHTERAAMYDQMFSLAYYINCHREAAISTHPMFDHIDAAEKQKVLNECAEAEAWLRGKIQEVKEKCEALDRFCRPIMTKPTPTPAKPATPELTSPAPFQGSESQPQGANNAGYGPGQDTEAGVGQEVPAAAAAEPMEMD